MITSWRKVKDGISSTTIDYPKPLKVKNYSFRLGSISFEEGGYIISFSKYSRLEDNNYRPKITNFKVFPFYFNTKPRTFKFVEV